MKQLVLFLITLYQALISPLLKQLLGVSSSCRFRPTCSRYTQEMIRQHGVLRGSQLGLKQLFACHPFSSYGHL